jgi:hypothetical protein
MHLFEFALRDLGNAERYAHEQTVFVVHDCDPVDAEASSRDRDTTAWTGDVWKLTFCLAKYRPDLTLSIADAAPSGLLVVSGSRPGSTELLDREAEFIEEFADLGYDYYEAHRELPDGLVRPLQEIVEVHGLGSRRVVPGS